MFPLPGSLSAVLVIKLYSKAAPPKLPSTPEEPEVPDDPEAPEAP